MAGGESLDQEDALMTRGDLIDRIMRAAGDMPYPVRHRDWLRTLDDAQLVERLERLTHRGVVLIAPRLPDGRLVKL